MDDNIYSDCRAKGLPHYPPPIHPEVDEVEAVSPVSPSILKQKDEAVEEETVNNASNVQRNQCTTIYICIKVQVYTNCF